MLVEVIAVHERKTTWPRLLVDRHRGERITVQVVGLEVTVAYEIEILRNRKIAVGAEGVADSLFLDKVEGLRLPQCAFKL